MKARIAISLGVLLFLTTSTGAAKAKKNQQAERIRDAAQVFQEIQGAPDKGIPARFLQSANGIIIVPGLKRLGFVFGGEYGKGVFVARLPSGKWSAPSMVRVEGGSFGLQLGAGETDLIMLAMNKDAMNQLKRSGVKIGGDVMAAAGPVGRQAEAATTPIPASGLLAYSRARGVFGGITLKGSTMRSDNDDNAKIYGRSVDQSDILEGKVAPTAAAQPLLKALRQFARK